MDKIKEAFEKRAKNMKYDLTWENDHYENAHTLELFLGYQMCQADQEARGNEIEKLKIAANKYKQMYVAKLKENKRLQVVLNHILAGYGKQLGDDFCNFIEKALEENK